MPASTVLSTTYRFQQQDARSYFVMSSCFSIKLTDEEKNSITPMIKFEDHPHFFYDSDNKKAYVKLPSQEGNEPQAIDLNSHYLQWYQDENGTWHVNCEAFTNYSYYLPTKIFLYENNHYYQLTATQCNYLGDMHEDYSSDFFRIPLDNIKKNIIDGEEQITIRQNDIFLPLMEVIFKKTDEDFEIVHSPMVKDKLTSNRQSLTTHVVEILDDLANKETVVTQPLTLLEQAQQQDHWLLKVIVLMQPVLKFSAHPSRFWNYLRTPYFMPSLGLKTIETIHSQWFHNNTFDFCIPAEDDNRPDTPYTLETFKIHYYQETQITLLGRYTLPYFLGHGGWLCLSFIPLPFIKAHRQRITLAKEMISMQKALTEKLEKTNQGNSFLALTGEKQQLNPWRFSAQSPTKYQLANASYRFSLYLGTLLFTTLMLLTLISILTPTPFLPLNMITAGILLTVSIGGELLCLQEIFNPGSLATALRKTLNQLAFKPTFIIQENQPSWITAFLLTSPLLLPFYTSYKSTPSRTELDKGNITQQSHDKNKNPLLNAYAQFIPTGNMQDTTLLRTLLNPFQLLQMTLTWATFSSFLIIDKIAKALPAFLLINSVLKTLLYGLYSTTFLLLNIPKQALSYMTHIVDSPITGAYKTINFLNSPYKGNDYVQKNADTIILTQKIPLAKDPCLFKDDTTKPTNKQYLQIRLTQLFHKASSQLSHFTDKILAVKVK